MFCLCFNARGTFINQVVYLFEIVWLNDGMLEGISTRQLYVAPTTTSAPIEAWKCNFLPFKEIMTNRRINQLTDRPTIQQTDMRGQREDYTFNIREQ